MKLAIGLIAALMTTTVFAQSRGAFSGPFTGYEAQALSEVWPQIRQAQNYADINWQGHGLARAPGNAEAQRIMAANWHELRSAQRFENIDWREYYDAPTSRAQRYGRVQRGLPENDGGFDDSPFTRDEAAVMSRAWGHIRTAARFEDINWRAAGLSGAPGNRDARRLMARHWGQLREAGRFEEIDWQATTGYGLR